MYAQPKLSLKPSELLQRQAHATFMFDPVAVNNRGVTGVSTLMWGNDYPHPEGTWPASRAADLMIASIKPGNRASRSLRRSFM